ncbi:heparinase II/III-like protein [Prosthecobacter fusiformis]|uniref:Heparinase II/III-like protein n=1 Tax=Prosthecobacter fusiformis TaxID=48464 RepID=A0A4R7S3N9_9BACT|nr:heparinase II/III family protein [Prosthecobacter fusiformis]TDU73012.1 heparinase II/III-like protein [Prosthecobacter fusiformis]
MNAAVHRPFATLLLTLSLPWLASAEMRAWKNKAGASIDAEMVAVDVTARTITIKRADGQTFTIPIDSLSDEDKAFAAEQWKKMQGAPAAPATADAPAAKTPPAAGKATARPAPPRPALTITPVNKFKVPNNAEYMRVVLKTRPRLIHAAPGWTYLKGLPAADPVAAKMIENLKAGGEKLLEAPELTRIFGEQKSTVTPGSKAMFRMAALGVLNFVDGDPRWKERGVREMIAITDPATFQNWYVDEPAVTADFLIAASLGYDYFRDGMNAKQATDARTYMIEKGIGALVALLKGEPVPESARGKAAGVTNAPKPKGTPKGGAKDKEEVEPDAEHMAAASALILAGICLQDEDPSAAKQAIDAGGKVFGKGMLRFAPDGIWPEGMEAGEQVLDYAIMVMQTLKANAGTDLGFSLLEGIPQAGLARLHLVGPSNQLFNYGDAQGTTLSRPWVSTWLAGAHGNMGTKALAAGAAPSADTAFLNLAGHFMYYNPHAAGDGTPDSPDYVFPGGAVAALRSSWDKDAYYVAVKGGDNSIPTAQLDIGSFVLEAGGVRWGIELGAESDRAPGFSPAADRTKRYALYVEGTPGQNTVMMGGNQELDAQSAVLSGHSTPELGILAVDLTKAYSKLAKDVYRGAMMVRGAKPYLVLQDDMAVKNTTPVTWSMHTRAEVTVDGSKATLTEKDKTLHAVILSPAGATFTTEDPPEPASEQMKKLTGIKVLKVSLGAVKGPQTISIAFSLDGAPASVPVKPITEWVPKK